MGSAVSADLIKAELQTFELVVTLLLPHANGDLFDSTTAAFCSEPNGVADTSFYFRSTLVPKGADLYGRRGGDL